MKIIPLEIREKMRLAAISRWGRLSERKAQSQRMCGRNTRGTGWHHSSATIAKMRVSATGYTHSIESRMKMSAARTGSTPWNKGIILPYPVWNKGTAVKTTEAIRFRRNKQYYQWRKAVFERDNYICQICGVRGGKLNADHIKKFADFLDLRYVLENGRTLCENCHRKTPTYGNRKVLV